jgi:hypothetical protein
MLTQLFFSYEVEHFHIPKHVHYFCYVNTYLIHTLRSRFYVESFSHGLDVISIDVAEVLLYYPFLTTRLPHGGKNQYLYTSSTFSTQAVTAMW